jgi:hypothetical protein
MVSMLNREAWLCSVIFNASSIPSAHSRWSLRGNVNAIAAEIGAVDWLAGQSWKTMIWNTSRVSSACILRRRAYALQVRILVYTWDLPAHLYNEGHHPYQHIYRLARGFQPYKAKVSLAL